LRQQHDLCETMVDTIQKTHRSAQVTTMDRNNRETKDGGRDAKTGRFLSGNIGGGRPKGSRNRLGEAFLSDLQAEWEKSGVEALRKVAETDPVSFVKVVASLLPREIDMTLDVDLLASAASFAQAYRFALEHIGAEPLLIEAEADDA
jgi:hypothetical protein